MAFDDRSVIWEPSDHPRILPVPPGHRLRIVHAEPFSAFLSREGRRIVGPQVSRPEAGSHGACFDPIPEPGDHELTLETGRGSVFRGSVRFLRPTPRLPSRRPAEGLILLTNGIGGMARMDIDLGRVRSKYDCVLGANLDPAVPTDRHIFVKRVRVYLVAPGFRDDSGWPVPLRMDWLKEVESGPPARWRYLAVGRGGEQVRMELVADMVEGQNTTVLQFRRLAGTLPSGVKPDPAMAGGEDVPLHLTVRVDLEDRDFHWETKRNAGAEHHFSSHCSPLESAIGFRFAPAPDRELCVVADGGAYRHEPEWSHNIPHPVEQSRGQTASGDAYSPGWFDLPLPTGAVVTLVLTAETELPPVDEGFLAAREDAVAVALQRAQVPADDAFGRQLAVAAQQFVVRRGLGKTVVAGYPWFKDWGRDSLICARGLLAAGMGAQVIDLLVVFGRFVEDGTMPNSIHGSCASDRDTSDAPLWYGIVSEETAAVVGDQLYAVRVDDSGRTLDDVLCDIARGYERGTPNGIRVDPDSGLVWSPAHFTWMDTNYPAGTPREGYPVEIQVLWIRLLRQLAGRGIGAEARHWADLADQAFESFTRYYWRPAEGYLLDLLACGRGSAAAAAEPDDALRCNYLFAVSLGLIHGTAARRCVDLAQHHLLIPGGVRSLAPRRVARALEIFGGHGQLLNDPRHPYWGRYEGDEDTRRKPAYHNGTAWTWLLPTFCEALARAWDFAPAAVDAARAYLGSLDELLDQGCLGQIPEILDGDSPHEPRGCDAQAWSVTEALRVWKTLQALPPAGTRPG